MRQIPEAIAHRGLHRTVPENTLEAFRLALNAGADAVELDVHATADGVVVVHHDAIVAGTADDPRIGSLPTGELSIEELSRFDLGGGAGVPRLGEVLDLLHGRARAYVEIKGWGIEELVVQCVRESGTDCAIHSFDHQAIRRVRGLAAEIPRGLLEQDRPVDPAAVLRSAAARDLWPSARTVDEKLVRAVHAVGGRVIAWTVNSAAEWTRLTAAGVDGVCTDNVDLFVAWRSSGS
ncbi:MAG TPA: glycerophosphodiester phosphodiesterase [Gemmatimonadaceae bacterium]|nr:glycerophosphodiester phosphodiesterase [Gemmatimonadaceae bacterium]